MAPIDFAWNRACRTGYKIMSAVIPSTLLNTTLASLSRDTATRTEFFPINLHPCRTTRGLVGSMRHSTTISSLGLVIWHGRAPIFLRVFSHARQETKSTILISELRFPCLYVIAIITTERTFLFGRNSDAVLLHIVSSGIFGYRPVQG